MTELKNRDFITFSESDYQLVLEIGDRSVNCRRFGDLNAPCHAITNREFANCGICPFANQDNLNFFRRLNQSYPDRGGYAKDQRLPWSLESRIIRSDGSPLSRIKFAEGSINIEVNKYNLEIIE
jgi:hypothetical protein